jgi:hypothetical protein
LTVAELIAFIDRKYSNSESSANKILDIDAIHKRTFMKLSRLSNNYTKWPDVTIANQLVYNFPSDCSPENVVLIQVSDASGEEWTDFKYAGLKDYISSGNCWTTDTVGTYALLEYGEVISTSDRGIIIYYYKTPASITLTTQTPELDSLYHLIIAYQEISDLASQGHNPDAEIADFWQRKADELFAEAKDDLYEKNNSKPKRSCQAVEEW